MRIQHDTLTDLVQKALIASTTIHFDSDSPNYRKGAAFVEIMGYLKGKSGIVRDFYFPRGYTHDYNTVGASRNDNINAFKSPSTIGMFHTHPVSAGPSNPDFKIAKLYDRMAGRTTENLVIFAGERYIRELNKHYTAYLDSFIAQHGTMPLSKRENKPVLLFEFYIDSNNKTAMPNQRRKLKHHPIRKQKLIFPQLATEFARRRPGIARTVCKDMLANPEKFFICYTASGRQYPIEIISA